LACSNAVDACKHASFLHNKVFDTYVDSYDVCYHSGEAFHCNHAVYESSRALVCNDDFRYVYGRIYAVYSDYYTNVCNDAFYSDVDDATGRNQS
jgi:hypothetical protein